MTGRLACACLMVTGCSFIFVSRPARDAASNTHCTDSYVAPVVDSVVGAGVGALSIALLAAHSNCTSDDCTASNVGEGFGHGLGAALLIPTFVYGISAISGFSNVGACRSHARGGDS